MALNRWNPMSDMLTLRDAMDRLFQESVVRPWNWAGQGEGGMMPVDMYEEDNTLVVKTAMPGVKPEDIDIRVEGDMLTISGETGSEQESQPQMSQSKTGQQTTSTQAAPQSIQGAGQQQTQAMSTRQETAMQSGRRNWYMRERRMARYTRTVQLPFPVDEQQAQATFDQGMLTLKLPKAEQARTKRIQVQAKS